MFNTEQQKSSLHSHDVIGKVLLSGVILDLFTFSFTSFFLVCDVINLKHLICKRFKYFKIFYKFFSDDDAFWERKYLVLPTSPLKIYYTNKGSSSFSYDEQLLISLPLYGEATKIEPHSPSSVWLSWYKEIEP